MGKALERGRARQAVRGGADTRGIVHRESGEPDRPKHLHDVRGTYVTHLCRAGLTDREIADITRLERAECHAHPPHVR